MTQPTDTFDKGPIGRLQDQSLVDREVKQVSAPFDCEYEKTRRMQLI